MLGVLQQPEVYQPQRYVYGDAVRNGLEKGEPKTAMFWVLGGVIGAWMIWAWVTPHTTEST